MLVVCSDDAFTYEESIVIQEGVVLLWILLALVQQEADQPCLQNITNLPKELKKQRLK